MCIFYFKPHLLTQRRCWFVLLRACWMHLSARWPAWFFHIKVRWPVVVVRDRFGPCVVVRGLSKDRPVTCWPCNPVSHADAVWIFLQSCLFPCCNLVTHPGWSIVGKLRADTWQRMHLIHVGWKKNTHTTTTTTGGGQFYLHAEFRHLWQSWLIRPLLARLRPGH